jgi:hypothetical protein
LDKLAAETQSVCDQIDAFVNRYLADDLAAEMSRIRLTKQQRRDFSEFKTHCAKLGLCHLPARPQAVVDFLVGRIDHGAQVVQRLRNSISAVHKTTEPSHDPTDDISIRALLRRVRLDNEKPQDTKGN